MKKITITDSYITLGQFLKFSSIASSGSEAKLYILQEQVLVNGKALNKEDYEAYNDKGNAYYRQGNFDEAIESYKKALSINPDFENAKYNLERTENALKKI